VRRELILDTGVAETNNQFHAALPLCEQLRGQSPIGVAPVAAG